jgi:hypothetical protein
MNAGLIVFLVIVILVSFYITVQYFNQTYLIQKAVPLNILNSSGSSSQSVIDVNLIDSPGSANYFYEGWFYINENAPVSSENVLFNRGQNFVVTLQGSTLKLYTNITATQTGTSQPQGVSSVGILNAAGLTPLFSVPNFPFQKWAHLVINVYGKTVDLYIDGKFVKNVESSQLIQTNQIDPITYGNQYTIGYMARFRRLDTNINPQGVWNSYMLGSGQNLSVSNYHINAQIMKNNQVRVNQRIV